MKTFVNWLKLHLLPPIGAWLVRLLGRSLTIGTEGAEPMLALHAQGRHCIFAFWHSRQLMMPLAYRGSQIYILISRHRDGELIQRIVSRFGLRAVRGSTTRGGTEALRELVRLGRSGVDLAITPDGPKGPRQVAQMGVIHLAKATGLPIIPVTFSCSKKNSSRAGIASWSHTRSDADCSGWANRSSWRSGRRRTRWKPSGMSWNRC
ncbi:MAG: lysophospholipid acyltransferase family protein [Nitrospiraceae bacterium]